MSFTLHYDFSAINMLTLPQVSFTGVSFYWPIPLNTVFYFKWEVRNCDWNWNTTFMQCFLTGDVFSTEFYITIFYGRTSTPLSISL